MGIRREALWKGSNFGEVFNILSYFRVLVFGRENQKAETAVVGVFGHEQIKQKL